MNSTTHTYQTIESPFTYNCQASGLKFLARKREIEQLSGIILERRNALIYETPGTGKRSLILQTLNLLQNNNKKICLKRIDLFRLSPDQLQKEIEGVADNFSEPAEAGCYKVIWLEEFQTIERIEDYDTFIRKMEVLWKKREDITFIITGSGYNAMKHIFEEKKYLYRFAERIKLLPIEQKIITDYIIKTFLRVGRVVVRKHADKIYESAEGNLWYIWAIANISFNLTKGYLSDAIVEYAINSTISIHEQRYIDTINSLSNYQIHCLRAVYDGHSRLTSSETISRYGLNTSANVHRLKEALIKKEVLTFDENDNPSFLDPMFRLWLKREFFR